MNSLNSNKYGYSVKSLFLAVLEEGTHSLTAWFAAAGGEGLHDFLADGAVELAVLEGRCDAPDVVEGNLGEGAAPLGGDTDTAQDGGDLVAQT